MTITVKHDQSSIDPSAEYTDEKFESVIEQLETQYAVALCKEFPDADMEFVRESDTYGHKIEFSGGLDYSEECAIKIRVQDILETVFEVGNFW